MISTRLIDLYFQACRIPDTKATKTERIKGIGFDSGIPHHSGRDGHDQRTAGDQTDFKEFIWDTETGIC